MLAPFVPPGKSQSLLHLPKGPLLHLSLVSQGQKGCGNVFSPRKGEQSVDSILTHSHRNISGEMGEWVGA